MMIAAITTSGLEYFYIAVREPGFNYDLPAIVFRRDGSIDDNYIIGIEGQSTSGVEINADELMDRLVKQETPAADADESTSDRQTDEWKAKLPKPRHLQGRDRQRVAAFRQHVDPDSEPVRQRATIRHTTGRDRVRHQLAQGETLPVREGQPREAPHRGRVLPQQGQDQTVPARP